MTGLLGLIPSGGNITEQVTVATEVHPTRRTFLGIYGCMKEDYKHTIRKYVPKGLNTPRTHVFSL